MIVTQQMLIHNSNPLWSHSTTSSSAAALQQEAGFLSVKGHGSAWLISYARWVCPNSKARRQSGGKDSVPGGEGRGGVRGLRGGGLGVEGLPMQKCKSWGCMLINKTATVSCKCELPLAISLHVWYSPCVPLSLTIVKVAWSTVSNSAF